MVEYSVSEVNGEVTVAFEISLDYKNPILSEEKILKISEKEVNDFYAKTQNSYQQYDLFFFLLNSFNAYLNTGKAVIAAKVAFLLSYYLHIALTPIANLDLALHFIEEAIKLDARTEYEQIKRSIEEDMGR